MYEVMVKVEIPDLYELACDHMRAPKNGELYLRCGEVQMACGDYKESERRVIVRPAWKWPEWLTAEAVAQSREGTWFAFQFVPVKTKSSWGNCGDAMHLHMLAFTPPPCTSWEDSLRINPNRK